MGLTVVQVKQTIGQMKTSIDKVEAELTKEEFKDYCDHIYSAMAYWKEILKNKEDESRS